MKTLKTWSWRNSLKVARWEFTKHVKSPLFLILTFLIPLIMVVAGGVGFVAESMDQERQVRVLVVDEANVWSFLSEHMVTGPAEFSLFEGSREEADEHVSQGNYQGYVVVNMEALRQGQVPFYVEDVRQANSTAVRRALEGPLTTYRLREMGLDDDQIQAVAQGFTLEIRSLGLEEPPVAQVLAPLAASMVLIMSTVLSGQILMYGVLKEKRNRIVEILLSSISSLELLLGKIAGFGLLSLLQIAIWVSAGLIVARRFLALSDLPVALADLIPSFIFFLLGYLLLASLFAVMGATMKDAEGGSQAQGIVVLIPMIPMFLVGIIMMNPDLWWIRAMSHIPPFIPMTMLVRLAAGPVAIWEMATSIGALLVSVVFFVFLGARIFEGAILQYDRSLNLRDIRQILRGKTA